MSKSETQPLQPAYRVGILGASLSTQNMGVSALATGCVKAALYNSPASEVFFLDYARDPEIQDVVVDDRALPIRLVNLRFSKKVYLSNNIAFLIMLAAIAKVLPPKSRAWLLEKSPTIKYILETDLFGSIGGGDSFSDLYGLPRFFYVALPQLLVLLLNRPLILLPQTLGPFRTRVARRVAALIFRRAAMVFSRDYEGLSRVRDMAGAEVCSQRLRFCYDLGFLLDPLEPTQREWPRDFLERRSVAGVNVSGLLWFEKQRSRFGLKVDYPAFLRRLVEVLLSLDWNVLLIPHVFGGEGESESDSAACEELHCSLSSTLADSERVVCLKGRYDQSQIKHVIGLMDLLVGSRMHACIAALSQRVPAVSVSYSPKFHGVMASLGLEDLVADPRTNGISDLIETVRKAIARRHQIQADLERRIPEIEAAGLRVFRDASLFA